MSGTIGWDVGGAHLKGARTEGDRVAAACQVPCQLWLGLDRLEAALAAAVNALGRADRHAVTMTGELVDYFAARKEGVSRIAELMASRLSPARVRFYGGRLGFMPPEAVASHVGEVASANWHATASFVASRVPDALFIDMGSTTTDLVPVFQGRVVARGYSDAARLAEGELVYTGLTRTPLMAVSARVPFRGRWVSLMNEYFSTIADAHRVLGMLDEASDQHPTADGRDKSRAASQARLARMLGLDAADASGPEWENVAKWFAEAQLRAIEDAARQVVSACELPADAPVVAAGVGVAIVSKVAARLDRGLLAFDALIEGAGDARTWSSACAPAIAVALLDRAAAE